MLAALDLLSCSVYKGSITIQAQAIFVIPRNIGTCPVDLSPHPTKESLPPITIHQLTTNLPPPSKSKAIFDQHHEVLRHHRARLSDNCARIAGSSMPDLKVVPATCDANTFRRSASTALPKKFELMMAPRLYFLASNALVMDLMASANA